MEAGQIPLSDPVQVQQYDLGKSIGFDFGTPFYLVAYRDELPLFRTEVTLGSGEQSSLQFLYWKVQDEPPFVPELNDIRDEVVDAWRMREARALAQAEGTSLAGQARQSA